MDAGTTNALAVVLDGRGRVVGQAWRRLGQRRPRPGWIEQDPAEIFEAQIDVTRGAMEAAGLRASSIRAVGLANQRESVVVWDRASGEPVHGAISWASRQSAGIVERWAAAGLNEEIRRTTGLLSDAYYSASKIAWILERVEGARERAERGELLAGTVDAWLLWNMTGGARFATDASNASRTMLFDLRALRWDEALCDALGVPVDMLPEVLPSDARFGTVKRELLGADVPVAGVLGDQHASLFGQACHSPGLAKATFGTAGAFTVNVGPRPVYREGLTTSVAWRLGDRTTYQLEGIFYAAGDVVEWLRDGIELISEASESERRGALVEHTQGVYLVPAFTGLAAPHWDTHARATIVGLSSATDGNHLVRAALEAIAFQTKDIVEATGGVAGENLRVDGGATENALLCQLLADILGVRVALSEVGESTALGAAHLAGLSCGLWSQEECSAFWRSRRVFEPDIPTARRARLYDGWKAAVKVARGWAGQQT